ncbi:Bromo adjacent homology (BAH) domain, partial [Arabidopsis thaliana x Arabidopsis arenosa]
KMLTKEILTQQLNEVLMSNDKNNVPFPRLRDLKLTTKEVEMEQKKRKMESEEILVNKKTKLEWRPEDCAQAIGVSDKCTGEGKKKKSHYKTFQFHANIYGLEDSVLLVPENATQKPYVAIIKDIYIQEKEEYVKLEVQWLYRPEDVEKKYVGKWEPKDSRDLFYSFHRDEVFAESQKREIDHLVEKTILRIGHLPDIVKEQKTLMSRSKRSVPQSDIIKAVETSRESNNGVNSILENFDLLTGDSYRDKSLEELLEVVKPSCRTSKKKQAGDYDSFWPNDVVSVVSALEQALYDSLKEDILKYSNKLEILVGKLKNSRVLARRLLDGELKPEQVIKMTCYELLRGFTFDELKADLEEPILEEDASSSTSRSVGHKDSFED